MENDTLHVKTDVVPGGELRSTSETTAGSVSCAEEYTTEDAMVGNCAG